MKYSKLQVYCQNKIFKLQKYFSKFMSNTARAVCNIVCVQLSRNTANLHMVILFKKKEICLIERLGIIFDYFEFQKLLNSQTQSVAGLT